MTTTPIELPIKDEPGGIARAADLLELVKPRMNFLVVATTMVGFYMAARDRADWVRLPAVLAGTALCAAAASVLNQVIERRRDGLMIRTRNRPLPTGRLDAVHALGFGLGLGVSGVGIMWFLINPLTAALAAFTLLSYVLIYTPLKPLTPLNTLVGAVPGAIPPVLGWTAVRGTFDAQSLALLTILFVWQIPHFMAIAILYKQDYATAGFKMLPVVDHDLSRTGRQIIIYSVALIGASCLPFVLHMAGMVYLVSAIVMSIGFLLVGMECAAKGTRAAARKLFLVSIIYLPLLLSVMMFTRIPN